MTSLSRLVGECFVKTGTERIWTKMVHISLQRRHGNDHMRNQEND